MNNQITISLKRGKLLFSFICSIGFVLLGLWLIGNPPKTSGPFFSNPTIVKIIGVSNIAFFGLCAFIIGRKLFDKKPGLVVDENGITDNTSVLTPGLIPWRSIKEISTKTVLSQKFILIWVQNPQQIIDSQKSYWKRKLLGYNFKNYGTPLRIAANSLKISNTELQLLLADQLKLYR